MFRSPSQAGLPGVDVMLDDLGATRSQVARHLGIAESTLATYQRTGNAPRAVMLALFWETRWGRSAADTGAHNAAQQSAAHAKSLQDHVARLAGLIWRLEMEYTDLAARPGGSVPANCPVFRVG